MHGGRYDTAIFEEPITFETADGIYDSDRPKDAQGFDFYSGGISLKKKILVNANGKRKFIQVSSDIGCAIEVRVNGKKAAVLMWKEYWKYPAIRTLT